MKDIIPSFDLPISLSVCVFKDKRIVFSYNENEVFPAASLVKVPLAVFILKKYQEGLIDIYSDISIDNKVPGAGIIKDLTIEKYKIIDLLTLCLILSDNTASNTLINLSSFEEINNFLQNINLRNTCINRKFMVDLVNPPVNFTTAYEMNMFYQKVLDFEILNKENTFLFFDILCKQNFREKIPLFLSNVKIANKTGDISGISHDSAVVFLDEDIRKSIEDRKYYIISVLASFDAKLDRFWVNKIIGEISLNVYNNFR